MSVYRKILKWLETELFEGRLELGQNLPHDRKLSSIIKASNSSTREALKQLETMGILRLYEGKRKTIIARLVSEPFSSSAPALRVHMATSRHPMRDMVQTRIMIESWAVAHAQPDHPAMAELDDILVSMQREGLMPQEFHQYEVNFHIVLTKLAGNQLVTGLMTALRESMYEYLLSLMGRVPLWSSTAIRLKTEHQAIVAALKAGDNETARQLVVSSIEHQYAEAGIDLDEETEVANDMPGTRATLEPVEVEQDDLLPEKWDDAVSPLLIEALENIGHGHTSVRSLDLSSGAQPTESVDEESVSETPSTDERNATHSGENTVIPSDAGEPSRQPSMAEFKPAIVRSAPTHTVRRRKGVVSSPVHATVVKPIVRPADSEVAEQGDDVVRASATQKTPVASGRIISPERAERERLERIAQLSAAQNAQEDSDSNEGAVAEAEQGTRVRKTQRVSKWLGWGRNSQKKSAVASESSEVDSSDEQIATDDFDEVHGSLPEVHESESEAAETSPDDDVQPEHESEVTTEQETAEADEYAAPEGYEFADDAIKDPELIDESAHAISKKAKKKKKRRR